MTSEQRSLSDIGESAEEYGKPYVLRRQGVEKPDEWKIIQIGDLLELEYGKSLPKKDREDGSYPVFGSNGRSGWHSDYHVDAPGIIVGRKGVNLGIEWADKDFNVIDTAYFINATSLNTSELDLRFLYYNLLDFDLDRLKSGSAVPGLNRNDFYEETVALPSLSEQKKIAEILGSLDRKIDSNRQTNQTLESLARAIFEQRFVGFEPYDQFKDSKKGKIPSEFEVDNLPELMEIVLGGTPKSDVEEYYGGEITWAKAKDVSQETEAFISSTEKTITEKGLEESSAELIPKGTTVITARGTVGETALTPFKMTTNQTCYGLVPKKDQDKYFLFFLVKSHIDKLRSRTHGTVFDTINMNTLREQEILLPPKKERFEFNTTVEPIMELIINNQREIETLHELRDSLLPKLISGEVRVNDINFEDLEVSSEV